MSISLASRRTPGGASSSAWRPLQRSTRVAIIIASFTTLVCVLLVLNPAHRGPLWLWALTVLAVVGTAVLAIGTWWTILAYRPAPEPAEVAIWRDRLRAGAAVPTIDVFVRAHGQPPELVRRTVRATREMWLPHRVLVLDGGGAGELSDLCADENVDYLGGFGPGSSRAGSVNAALARSSGEYVVMFDAGYAPEPDFLIRVLPYFRDHEVAFVQSPEYHDNLRSLVSIGSAQALGTFSGLVCPGKNRFNAAFSAGTNVMFRRAALDAIGGIPTGGSWDGIWTSLALHRRGWKSVYLPQVLASGLAPEDVPSYLRVQSRRARGEVEVLLWGRLFRRRNGLTLDQRLQYALTGAHSLGSAAMLVFLLLPAAYLLFGASPVAGAGWTWAGRYLPFWAMMLLAVWLQSGALRAAAVVTGIGIAPVRLRALWSTLRRKPVVVPAADPPASGRCLWAVMPHLALLALNVTAIAVGFSVMVDRVPTWLCAGWAGIYVLILGRTIIEAARRHPARAARWTRRHRVWRVPGRPAAAGAAPAAAHRGPERRVRSGLRTAAVAVVMLAVVAAGGVAIGVHRLRAQEYLSLGTATLTADTVPVGPPVAGTVRSMQVTVGSHVTAGQALATLTVPAVRTGQAPSTRTVRAPMDAVVAGIDVTVGGMVGPDEPVVTLYDRSTLTFQAPVRADRLARLRLGMAATLSGPAASQRIPARLARIVPRMDGTPTGTGRLTVVLEPQPSAKAAVSALVPGLPFTATVNTRTSTRGTPAVNSAG